MFILKKILMITIIALFLTGAYGCKKEGPAERAGKQVDKAVDDVKKKFDDVTK
jgi:hypothetical protein